MRKKRNLTLLIIFIVFFSFLGFPSYSLASNPKTLIIVLDELDFDISKRIISNDMSLGLMSIKTAGLYKESSKESLFMTMAEGRRLKIKRGLYQGTQSLNTGSIQVQGYDNIIKDFKNRYPNFSRKVSFLGDNLKENGIRTGFLGKGPSSLLVANKEGQINRGIDYIDYNNKWLKENTDELLKYIDVLVVSYEIDGKQNRIQILKDYIDEFNDVHLYVFPENIKGDISYRLNSTLVPLIYRNIGDKVGVITSNTTKREGLVSSLDIKVDIETVYGINKDGNIGNKIYVYERSNIIEENEKNLLEFLNLNIIKYVFHGYVIISQIYILYNYIFKKKRYNQQHKIIMTSVLLSILLSIIYGLINLHRYIIVYCTLVILSSLVISKILIQRGINPINAIATMTNILILIGVYFNFNIVYDSFIGYNNIVAAGRFYGLNNDIMGVLIATSIITFYSLKRLISNYLPPFIALLYFPIVILALSGKYGANVGGYITSIVLFLILIYLTLFSYNKTKKGVLALILIGIVILGVSVLIDSDSANPSHAGKLVERIKIFGLNELTYIINVKLKQLITMSLLPPWSIIILFQLFFLRRFYKEEKQLIKPINKTHVESFEKYCIIFVGSIIAFIINDTGAVSFTYINTYLIASLFNTYKLEL